MQFFENLPSARTTRAEPVDWSTAKANLIANPGQWGLIAEKISASTPGALKSGRNKAFRGEEIGNFEFRTRRPEGPSDYSLRQTDLYGRFIGA